MAEMVWALLLFPSKIRVATKRLQIGEIWALSGESLDPSLGLLSDEVLSGIGSGGPGFNNHRWREVAFLISLVGDLKSRPEDERRSLLTNYDAFIDWLNQVPQGRQRQFRHMLRYFCFPDRVERMSSNRVRCAVLVGCGKMSKKAAENLDDRQLDIALKDLRDELEAEHPGQALDFYESPLLELWKIDDEEEISPLLIATETSSSIQLGDLVKSFENDTKATSLQVSSSLLHRFSVSLLSKRFLISTGLAGSGKTKLAQAFANWISPPSVIHDVFTPGSEIPSSNITYYVKKSDTHSVEFWNSKDEQADTIKVTLPREMINEWAAYIEKERISPTIQARVIREGVKATSRFSDQLHSFETHLKAAAFALIRNQKTSVPGIYHALIPVGADWTGSDSVLGYPDGLQISNYVTKPALNLILHALSHPETPHFLILDEMNLSHVERYFSDILSSIESEDGLDLYSGSLAEPETWRTTAGGNRVPPKIKNLPQNLFIIGTVNVDETTYMFSPKVLDRANVIEFRMDAAELEEFLDNPTKPNLMKLEGKGASFGKAFVDAAKNPVAVPADVKAAYDGEMLLLFRTLQENGAEFGYRTVYETARFIHFYKLLGNHEDGDTSWFPAAFDCVVFQKLLPKLHGSRTKLGPVLKKLWFLCVTTPANRGTDTLKSAEESKAEPNKDIPAGAPYPLSAEKIYRMWRLMMDNGFTSFAEA